MSNAAPPPPPSTPAETPAAAARRRRDQATILVDAKTIREAVKDNLAGFVEADKTRVVKRIEQGWLTRFDAMIAAAETAVDGRAVRLGAQKAATADERTTGDSLAEALQSIRDDVKTSFPDNEALQRSFGYGTKINPKFTSALLETAGSIAQAFAKPKLQPLAIDAGVTQERIDAMTAIRTTLSGADVSQRKLFASNVDGTVQKDALMKALKGSTAYARAVAKVVFKKEPAALAAFAAARAPLVTKEAKKAAPTTAPAKKKKRAKIPKGKARARRAQIAARAKAMAVGPSAAAAAVVKKKAASKKKTTKRGAKKTKPKKKK